jgi:hypothetical protein
VETAAIDGSCLFQRFRPFAAFETIQSRPNVRVHVNTGKVIKCIWKNSVYGGNLEIIAITEILFKIFVSV